ncbi:NADH-quinone oxidoreductase subunit N [Paenibacillus methanolicus]|uniref:NADH-quinone oxidoreductase subunit N n=1 Tax=Paenibacillus methanolicus TaxID=582686 RepID=A0A5S5CCF8_9BACL|nr:NADH-quinone oxidoreductase subunit N [Paenibacillus methanolicus]
MIANQGTTATVGAFTWSDALYLAPEGLLIVVALLLILIDLALPSTFGRNKLGWLTLAGLLGSGGLVIWRMAEVAGVRAEENGSSGVIRVLADSYRIDHFAGTLKLIFLLAAALVVLMSNGTMKREETPNRGEYYYLMLPAVVGAMIMVSSGDLITLYVGLELLSVTTYVLVGMRKQGAKSAEAAFKYVVTGGLSSAFILFGMSYLYGVGGSTNIGAIANVFQTQGIAGLSPLLAVGLFMLIAGFGIKIAAAPFHAWAPDVVEGSSSPVAAFLAVVSKGAALAVVFRIVYNIVFFADSPDGDIAGDTFLLLLVLAAASMLIGTLTALRQRQLRRLLALSGVANAGYLLVPLGLSLKGMHASNFGELLLYLLAYTLMTIGAFAVVATVTQAADDESFGSFAGLYHRAPWTATAMLVFLLSLAGLPLTGGFFGKLFILFGAAQSGAYWLVAVMAVSSVISYYFYFAIARQMFMRTEGEDTRVPVSGATGAVIWMCVLGTLVLGVWPGVVFDLVNTHFSIVGDLLIR